MDYIAPNYTLKTQIYPTQKQKEELDNLFRVRAQVWNWGLAFNEDCFKHRQIFFRKLISLAQKEPDFSTKTKSFLKKKLKQPSFESILEKNQITTCSFESQLMTIIIKEKIKISDLIINLNELVQKINFDSSKKELVDFLKRKQSKKTENEEILDQYKHKGSEAMYYYFNKYKSFNEDFLYKVPICFSLEGISTIVDKVFKSLDGAYKAFFDPKRINSKKPKYKKSRNSNSFMCQGGALSLTEEDYSLRVRGFSTKHGPIKLSKDKFFYNYNKEKIKQISINKCGGKYYCSITFKNIDLRKYKDISSRNGKYIGIDWGVNNNMITSEGDFYESLSTKENRRLRILEKRKKQIQRQMNKKIEVWKEKNGKNKKYLPSNLYLKAQAEKQKIEFNISNIRKNKMHERTSNLIKNIGYSGVAIEQLNIVNMTKSARGTIDDPGIRVPQKSGLNKSILENVPGMMKEQIRYKSNFYGTECQEVPSQNTSITCYECGHISSENRKKQSEFKCINCGHIDHADINAAKNIKNKANFMTKSILKVA